MFTNILKSAQGKKNLICLYTDKYDTEKFSAGYVYEVDEQYVLLEHFNPFGAYDGYVLKNINDIFLVEEGNKYIQKLQVLLKSHKKKHDNIHILNDDLLQSILLYAKETRLIVSVQLVDSGYSDVQGLIKEISESDITVLRITDFGEEDGLAYFNTQDVTNIICDSDNEQAIKMLFESQTIGRRG